MTSILTNTAAQTALQTLRTIGSDLATTQERISTGQKVNSASDNAAYWSIATSMRSDQKALGTVGEALGMGAAKVDVASRGMESALEVTAEIRNKLVAAKEGSVDRAKLQEDIVQLQEQLVGIAKDSSFQGNNFLYAATDETEPGTQSILSSFGRDAEGAIRTGTIEIDTSATVLVHDGTAANGILSQDRTAGDGSVSIAGGDNDIEIDADTTDAALDAMIAVVDEAMKEMTSAASTLGSASRRIDMQSSFVSKLSDAMDRGIGQLVDADMSEESTRLNALQVQQQLGIQALSIANQNSQNILSLFR